MSSREILEEDSDDDGLTGAGMDKLVDEGVPHPKHQEELQRKGGASNEALALFAWMSNK